MDFGISPEHEELRKTLRLFFEKEAPTAVVAENDRLERFPDELYAKVAALGLCGMAFSEAYGGSDADEISICIAMEEMSRATATLVYTWAPTVTFCARGIDRFGTEEQKRSLLPEVAAGRMRLAMGLSEPDAGSDLTHLSTRAVRDGSEYVVRGQKIFTTGADTADYVFAFVRTDPDAPIARGLSVLLIPREAEGVTVRPLRKLSGQGTHTCEVFLDDVRVPAENLVGPRGRGYAQFLRILDEGRIAIAALSVGVAQGCVDECVKYAKEREAFGVAIGTYQAIAFKIARMEARAHTARTAYYDAAALMLAGKPFKKAASIAKMVASEAAMDNARDATQVFGGYGFMNEYPVARHYRDSKILEIGEGTTEVQLMLIAREVGL
jgi:alkylation response protein AidB-like acyl-CoA dehydrogenase